MTSDLALARLSLVHKAAKTKRVAVMDPDTCAKGARRRVKRLADLDAVILQSRQCHLNGKPCAPLERPPRWQRRAATVVAGSS